MTVYPSQIDDDRSIIRIDDNLSELGTSAINQLREAVFAIEKTLGLNPQGSKSSLNERVSVLIGPDGNPRADTLEAIGLVTLPIHDNQIAHNAGIKESKLDLTVSTADLATELSALSALLDTTSSLIASTNADLRIHITGGEKLSDNVTLARHVASHIDINAVPMDVRDTFTWNGLRDRYNALRPATQVASALQEINDELVVHENATKNAHPATAITLDGTGFTSLPADLGTVQAGFNYIDNKDTISTGLDRATLNSNGIARGARAQDLNIDGYNVNIIPVTKVQAFLAEPSQQMPHDSVINGDDVIQFLPDSNTSPSFSFDTLFAEVKVGDIVRINYGNGIEAAYPIKSIRFIPGAEWVVRINAYNLFKADGADGYDGYARIDRARFDNNTWGVLAASGAVSNLSADITGINTIDGVVIGSPRGAVAVGIGFDPNKLDANHNLLYLRLYVHGTPENFVDLPAIDVTGNLGLTPGKYSIDRVVEETNKQFHKAGYNYRFLAFNHHGEFGVMLADDYGGAAFSIISGEVQGPVLETSKYVRNVVADATDGYDALGLGGARAGFATPVAPSGYLSGIEAANFATLVIPPVRSRNFLVNGARRDLLGKPRFTEGDGYWLATVTNITTSFVEETKVVDYTVNLDLSSENLKPGRSIVVQPSSSTDTSIEGYGRFIISNVSYQNCGSLPATTTITVINGVHGIGDPIGPIPGVGTVVKIYFSDDSVGFNVTNLVGSSGNFHRYHEIFISDIGRTFAVERARMPKQVQASNLLDTNSQGWRIRRVSPKLKGYRSGVDFRYFIRYVMMNYNSTTGEYDGYICEPGGFNRGPITRGRKDHPIRYYDKTYVNYIDIEFREDSTIPGTVLMSDNVTPRYVDIEVFSTLRENDEFFAIAGVSHDVTNFRSITDLREFGTTSEKNFSDSAIRFIEAGERYLHANGVVRGFRYEGTGFTDSVLEFAGGMALVNGSFVALDSLEVKLPEIKTSASDSVEFFICVTDTGQLKAVIKDTGVQFFTKTTPSVFVETLSFADIVDNRKDLTIIARVRARIATFDASVTYDLLEVTDARRHVINQDLGSYTFAIADEADGYNANFITADALMNWVNEYGIKEVKVWYVKQNLDTGLVLNFKNPVNLKGGVWEISKILGVQFPNGNCRLSGATFVYNPDSPVSITIGEIFSTFGDYGAVYVPSTAGNTISDLIIEDCKFFSDATVRAPFVALYGYVNTFKNVRFTNNTFNDSVATMSLAYAFVNASATSSGAPLFSDVVVSGTKINGSQGIIVTGRGNPDLATAGVYLAYNRSDVKNFILRDNNFGYIGLITEGDGLVIDNNTTDVILYGITATLHTKAYTYGFIQSSGTAFSTGVSITNNNVGFVKVDVSAGINSVKKFISGNKVHYTSTTTLLKLVPPSVNLQGNNVYYGITLVSRSYDVTNTICSGNIVDGNYSYGIFAQEGGVIANNVVTHIPAGGWGIFVSGNTPEQVTSITGNTLHREHGVLIGGFISHNDDACVIGNTLSHYNLNDTPPDGYDGYDGYTVYVPNFQTIIPMGYSSHNVNQAIKTTHSLVGSTPILHNTNWVPDINSNDYIMTWVKPADVNTGMTGVFYNKSSASWIWNWYGASVSDCDGIVGLIIPLLLSVPSEASLLAFQIDYYIDKVWGVANNGTTTATSLPEIILEIDGVIAARKTLNTTGTHTLYYESASYLNNARPPTPNTQKNAVIRIRQTPDSNGGANLVFGKWPGPIVANTYGVLEIKNAMVTYLF